VRPGAAAVVELVRRAVESRAGRHVVIVLDEFGGPLRGLAEGRLGVEFFDVVPLLMDLRLPLSLVLVTVPQAQPLMHRTGVWNLLRNCQDRQIGALEPADARRMIVQPFGEQGVPWDDEATRSVLRLTGRFPVYIILLSAR